jgi:hypothetical protein
MLRAAASAADAANASLFVSLEKQMPAALSRAGCTCQTEHGRKRVSKDGPVIDYREVSIAIHPLDLTLCGISLKNPVSRQAAHSASDTNTPSDGCFAIGGISGKGLTHSGSAVNKDARL